MKEGEKQAQWETVAYFKHKSNNKYLHASTKVTKKSAGEEQGDGERERQWEEEGENVKVNFTLDCWP